MTLDENSSTDTGPENLKHWVGYKVTRGGSWVSFIPMSIVFRNWEESSDEGIDLGFRCGSRFLITDI